MTRVVERAVEDGASKDYSQAARLSRVTRARKTQSANLLAL